MTHELAEKIVEEIEEKQQEMAECDHESISRNEDKDDVDEHIWHCEECGMAFEPKQAEPFDPDVKIRRYNCSMHD